MRVLLIAYHYPPSPAVGAIRAGRIAASLMAAGHQVEVLSVRERALPALTEDGRIRIRRVRPAFDLRRTLVELKAFVRQVSFMGRNGGPAVSTAFDRAGTATSRPPPTHVPTWRRYLGAVLWLPDDHQGWIPSLVTAGLGSIARGVDVMYTTAPPYSAHVAGLVLRSLTGVRWVAEQRDPWLGNPFKPWFVRARLTDAVDAWLERRCLMNADLTVAVTAAAAKDLASRRGEPGAVVLVRNGIPELGSGENSEPAVDEGMVRSILYVGSLYHRRDPRPFLQGLAHLRKQGQLPPVSVEFIGNCARYEGENLEALCADLGIGDVVRFVPPIPHHACQERMRAADLLLLFAQEQPSQVPQKLYEYLAARRPVVAFADEEGETAHMLREVGGQYLITGTQPAEIAEVLATALKADRQATTTASPVLAEWSATQQMKWLVNLVEEVGS